MQDAYEYAVAEFKLNWEGAESSGSLSSVVALTSEQPQVRVAPVQEVLDSVSLGSFMTSSYMAVDVASASSTSSKRRSKSKAAAPATVKCEMELYLEAAEKQPIETDLLAWWQANEKRWPKVALMAKQYLGCPATSAGVERLFSSAGRTFSDLRHLMDSFKIESVLFAKHNNP